jgi:hypothetical protein
MIVRNYIKKRLGSEEKAFGDSYRPPLELEGAVGS